MEDMMQYAELFLRLAITILVGLSGSTAVGEELALASIHFQQAAAKCSLTERATNPARNRLQIVVSSKGIQIASPPEVAEGLVGELDDDPIADGTLLIQCDRIAVAGGNPTTGTKDAECTGDVVVRSNSFSARADRLVMVNRSVILTGDDRPVHFSGQPSKEAKLYVSMAAKRVAVDLDSNGAAAIEP
jgi:hypothetical protein